jgi:hypothetical protein
MCAPWQTHQLEGSRRGGQSAENDEVRIKLKLFEGRLRERMVGDKDLQRRKAARHEHYRKKTKRESNQKY